MNDKDFLNIYKNDTIIPNGLFNSLIDTPDFIEFFKIHERIRINKPKLNLCAYMDFKETVDNLKIECNSNNGLFCKALISASKSTKYTSEEINLASTTAHVKLISVLHLIGVVHKLERKYTFSQDAQNIMTNFYNSINRTNVHNANDPFLM